jgi:class 3 adenylate cyclase
MSKPASPLDGPMPDDPMPDDPGQDQPASAPATVVIAPDSAEERSTPVYDWLFAGRECVGVEDQHRLLIDDPRVSRTHLELRLDLDLDQAWLTDHSTNGTRLNGRRIERSVPVGIKPGDRIRLGGTELEFRSQRFAALADDGAANAVQEHKTVRQISVNDMAMVVGDIVSFSTIAENTDDGVLLENMNRLYSELRQILSRHHGTLSNYVGDAFFATWEAAAASDAARAAVAFAVEAAETVPRIAADLELRDPEGGPVHMGWGVASGQAAVTGLTGMIVTVVGDTTNVAFRLSGIAGRDGWPDVLVTDVVYRATSASFTFTRSAAIQVKGRRQAVEAFGASRLASG